MSVTNSSSVLSPPPSPNDSSSVAEPLVTSHQRLPPIRRAFYYITKALSRARFELASPSFLPNMIIATFVSRFTFQLATANHQSKYSGSDEPNTEVCINHYLYHCCKICAKKRQTRYLPEDLLFNILSLLPAQVLHDVMRHVYKDWNFIIRSQHFIRQHLRNSTSGILIQCPKDGNRIYVEFQRGCLEIHKFDRGVVENVAWTSSNGLVLALDCKDNRILHVINPLTKQHYNLPQYSHHLKHHADFCLAYVEAAMKYKVVHARHSEFSLRPQIAVLTIGVDKDWRYIDIDIEHFSLITDDILTSSLPLVTGAYVHWIGGRPFGDWTPNNFVLTLNVETETVRMFPYPQSWWEDRKALPMGCNLSFIYGFRKNFKDVWEMNPETGKWIKLFRGDLRPMIKNLKDLFPECRRQPEYWQHLPVPRGWLKVREVMLFSWLGVFCIAYNLKTKEIHPFKLDTEMNHFQPHMKSLISLD